MLHLPSLSTHAGRGLPVRAVIRHRPQRCRNNRLRAAPESADAAGITVAQEQCRRQLKTELRQLVTRLNQAPDAASRASLVDVVDQLSALNPNPDSALSPLINGRWALLYTASASSSSQPAAAARSGGSRGEGTASSSGSSGSSSVNSDGLASALPFLQAVSDQVYQVFYRYVPILAGSAVGKASSQGPFTARGNFQEFDTARSYVLNQARFTALGQPCEIRVSGDVTVVPAAAPGAPSTRFKATFREGGIIIGDGIARTNIPIPIGWLSPVGYVDTPYLDEELRISRGDKGSIFIAARVQPGRE